jgi:hypothetical protein
MIVSPVSSVEASNDQSQPGMNFLREVLPTVVREVGCQARAGKCEETCPCSLCRVMFTFESNAITMADLLFGGQQFFGTRPVAQRTRELRDTWGVSNFFSYFILHSLQPGVSPYWDTHKEFDPMSENSLWVNDVLKELSLKLSPPSLEESQRHATWVKALTRMKYGSVYDSLAHEVEHNCLIACELNLHCFLAIQFMSDTGGGWSDRLLFRGTMVVSVFLELSSHTRLIPKLFTRPNIVRIFLEFIPNLLDRRIFASGTDYMFLTEAAIGVLDVLATVLGNWPCEANSKGSFSVKASAVSKAFEERDWPGGLSYRLELLKNVVSSDIVSHCESVSNVPELQGEWANILKRHIVRFKKVLHVVEKGYDCIPWYTYLDIERKTREDLSSLPPIMQMTMVSMNRNRCYVCNSMMNVLKCSGCYLISYCGKKCQNQDWPRHKDICKLLKIN